MQLLYFHGFASSPGSAKVRALEQRLPPLGFQLTAPDLNVPSFEELDWEQMVEVSLTDARRIDPAVIVGSSLGALVALAVVAAGIRKPLVLIAPALGVARRWQSRLPEGDSIDVWNHATNSNRQIHRRFFDQMANLHIDDQPPPTRVIALMGSEDETVPFSIVEETWQHWTTAGLAPGSRFVAIPGGRHGLEDHVDAITAAICEAADRGAPSE